jgi:hypothetical protein
MPTSPLNSPRLPSLNSETGWELLFKKRSLEPIVKALPMSLEHTSLHSNARIFEDFAVAFDVMTKRELGVRLITERCWNDRHQILFYAMLETRQWNGR